MAKTPKNHWIYFVFFFSCSSCFASSPFGRSPPFESVFFTEETTLFFEWGGVDLGDDFLFSVFDSCVATLSSEFFEVRERIADSNCRALPSAKISSGFAEVVRESETMTNPSINPPMIITQGMNAKKMTIASAEDFLPIPDLFILEFNVRLA